MLLIHVIETMRSGGFGNSITLTVREAVYIGGRGKDQELSTRSFPELRLR